ncbi:MAG: hypothetical protein J0I32_14710 [Sphingobacteriales bacterium]|nr:hypothetical protein [Sphingobacteriales bacterium]OJW01567.1 MAG: hypothetical protein BGO52_13855 [Sphingobacteriales bacterium 44-61]
MKHRIYLFLLLNLNTYMMQAQISSTLTGEYQLRGVMEMASGLLLKPDSSFEFFFSYGAMDRSGSGKWQWIEKDSLLVLNTPDRHAADYTLLQSRKDTGDLTAIHINDKNVYFLSYTQVRVHTDSGIIEGVTDNKGFFTIPRQPVKKIELLFELCPERFSSFTITNSNHTYFEFRFEPWITEVYFNNVILKPTKGGLEGGHPLLQGQQYKYQKLE